MIRFRTLGTLDLRNAQDRELPSVLRRPKLLALLAYLGIARPLGFHRRDTLVALLWPELDSAHARSALRQAVHALRQALGHDVVVARGEEEIGLRDPHLWCDVREFEAALEAGQHERALELFGGELLHGLHVSGVPPFERWLDDERERMRRRACEAAQLLADAAEAAGNAMGAARWAQRLTELAPFDETAVQRLIGLLDRLGDRAGAVRAYEEFARRLGRDLEVQPSPETLGLITSVRTRQQTTGAPVVQRELSRAQVGDPPRRSRAVTALLSFVVAGLLVSGWLLVRAAPAPKRLAVLSPVNLGPPADEYFTDGITEEITTRLGGIDRLRVIGRTSASAYKGTRKTLQQIGAELGVDYVVEGSIQWEKPPRGPARVRITSRLVSTADGTQLWAEVYDEPLDEIFRVQSEIAKKVVQALDITLPDPQRRVVEAVPTTNLEAYDYYLRGNQFLPRSTEERSIRSAVRMYEKGAELDPGFALAYARLSLMHSVMYWMHYDHSQERLARAKQAVDKAFELAPGLPEAHHALAAYYFRGSLQYERALGEIATAQQSRPNDGELFLLAAAVWTRRGDLHEALTNYERALQLDPGSARVANTYAQTYDRLRDFAHAEALYDRAIALSPDWAFPYSWKAGMYLRWDASTRRARTVLDEARTVGVADNPLVVLDGVLVDLFDRNYSAVLGRLSSTAPEVISDQFRFIPRAQLYAQVYGLMGRLDLETAYYDSARSFVLKRVHEQPEDSRLHSALGIAYAGLGRKREAVQEGERAVELLPISQEAYRGYYREWDLARIYTMIGAHDSAVARLEYLLSIPGNLTSAWLRIDPAWDSLRSHPRFRRMLGRAR